MNEKTKKILFILPYVVIVILVAVIIWMASVISSQGGIRHDTNLPNNTTSQETDSRDPVVPDSSADLTQNTFGIEQTQPEETKATLPAEDPANVVLTIPEMWQEHMYQERIEEGDGYKTLFYCQVNGTRVDLFAICFGVEGEELYTLGTLSDDSGAEVAVSLQAFDFTPGSDWTDTDITRVYAMQEEINTMIERIQSMANFTSSY